MEKLVIIDGHHLLFKMFYGIPNKILNKSGLVVNGVLGFSSVLFKLLNELKPQNVFVVFDSEQQLNRALENEEYKSNRPDYSEVPQTENPFSQLPLIEKVLNYMNITYVYSSNGLEADDLIAKICRQNKNKDKYILSGDTDFLQLVDFNTTILNYQNKEFVRYDTNKIYEKYGVYPKTYALYKALVGDTADNLRGVPKIGKVTASKIVNDFNTIEKIYDNINVFSDTIRQNLLDYKYQLISNYELINLNYDNSTFDFPSILFSYDYESQNSREILKLLEIF